MPNCEFESIARHATFNFDGIAKNDRPEEKNASSQHALLMQSFGETPEFMRTRSAKCPAIIGYQRHEEDAA
jgi:hypothetical protein